MVIAREMLIRNVDYQIDYATGDVLLNRAIPSTDGAGNHLFIVAAMERRTGSDQRFLGGVRFDVDAGKLAGWSGADSLHVHVIAVHDGSDANLGSSQQDMVGAGVRMQHGAFYGSGDVFSALARDNALAGRALVGWRLRDDAAHVTAEWMRVTSGFDPLADPRFGSGMQDIRLSAGMRVTRDTRMRLTHSRQRFDSFGAERQNTMLHLDQQLLGRALTTQAGLSTDVHGLDRPSSSLVTGRLQVPVTDGAGVWVEGAHALQAAQPGPASPSRPSQIGLGAYYRLFESTKLELAQRWVGLGDTKSGYTLTSVKVRNQSSLGTIWGGLEHAAAEESANAVNVGWNPRVTIRQGWTVHAMVERKFGLERAPLLDVQRALPFPQLERNRWATALGSQWVAADTLSRVRVQGELHGGELLAGQRLEMLGEMQLSSALALMTQHDWWRQNRTLATGEETSRRDRSVLGVALRPNDAGTLNILSKLEWRRSLNPGAGARFSSQGEDQRLIGMVDAIWSVGRGSELLARYAVRSRQISNRFEAADAEPEGEIAHYLGGRVGRQVHGPVTARLDGRALLSGGYTSWNVAPSVALRLNQYIEIEGGYRFGNMQDVDFSAHGDQGVFVTIGIQFTEQVTARIADFWRDRIAAGR
jgi:hypothetical protein